MLNKFGSALKRVRFERDRMTLGELAKKLGLSVAYISALETGRKPVPPDFVSRLTEQLQLDHATAAELDRLAIETVKEVSISVRTNPDARARELAVAFARRYEQLESADISALLNQLTTPKE